MTYLKSEFPEKMRYASPDEKKEYFKSVVKPHQFFQDAVKEIMSVLKSGRANLIFVCGPPGVGKEALAYRLIEIIYELMLPELKNDPGRIPVGMISLRAPGSSRPTWPMIHRKAMLAMNEPLVDKKVDYKGIFDGKGLATGKRNRSNTLPVLLDAHIETLKQRKPYAFIFNEAQHLTLVANAQRLVHNLEYVKTIADESKVPHILIGTYTLYEFKIRSGQIIRRSKNIHFPRYRADVPEELEIFKKILVTLLRQLPLEKVPDPAANGMLEFFIARCVGCVGILRDWLVDALSKTLELGLTELTYEILEMTALPESECLLLTMGAMKGEQLIAGPKNAHSLLWQVLGFEEADSDLKVILDQYFSPYFKLNKPEKKGNRRPGVRNPTRDPVGVPLC